MSREHVPERMNFMWPPQSFLSFPHKTGSETILLSFSFRQGSCGHFACGRWVRAHTAVLIFRSCGTAQPSVASTGTFLLLGFPAWERRWIPDLHSYWGFHEVVSACHGQQLPLAFGHWAPVVLSCYLLSFFCSAPRTTV